MRTPRHKTSQKTLRNNIIRPLISHPAIMFAGLTLLTGILVFVGLPITLFTVVSYIIITVANAYLINYSIVMRFYNNHDSLTHLPNRQEFYNELNTIVNGNNSSYILIMDLNDFKYVNDTLGHQVGDMLLKQAANRINNTLRRGEDLVARIGGDEFAVILSSGTTEAGSILVAERLVQSFTRPFQLEKIKVEVNISVGIAYYPTNGMTVTELIKHAEVAMYTAKNEKLGYFLYDKTKDSYSTERLSLPSDLKNAINNNEFQILGQPKIDITTKKLVGIEILLRWHHPVYGIIMPDKFIKIAESIGYINAITIWVLQQAIDQQLVWMHGGFNQLQLSVNVSANNISDPHTLKELSKIITQSNINPHNLIFEITETALLTDIETAMEHLTSLHSLGVKLSIDDFGTGHSSFTYLKHLPIYEIKIDKSFVMSINDIIQDYNIVKSSITVAHDINCIVTAEGVEDIQILNTLKWLGCDIAQGHYITKPLPIPELTEWMYNYTKNH